MALFLVRAWSEEGRLYARIRHSLDVSDEESEYLTTDPDEVIRYLRAWLHDVNPTIVPTSPAPWIDADGA